MRETGDPAALLPREIHGEHRAVFGGRFDDDDQVGQCGLYPVPKPEGSPGRRDTGRILRHQASVAGDQPLRQIRILGRIHAIEPVGHHRHADPRCIVHATDMRFRIAAPRQSGHDRDPFGAQLPPELARLTPPERCRLPRPDDGDSTVRAQRSDTALAVQDGAVAAEGNATGSFRRLQRRETFGKARVAGRQRSDPVTVAIVQHPPRRIPRLTGVDRLDRRPRTQARYGDSAVAKAPAVIKELRPVAWLFG